MADAYTALAPDYHWLYDAFSLRVGTRTPGIQAAIARLAPGARVLDAACGIGIDASSLHRRGFRVVGADANPAMVRQGQETLAATGADVPVVRCAWERLGDRFGAEFDAVLCTGNSLAHAGTRAARRAALRGFARVLVPGGTVLLDSQDWEAVHAAGSRHETDPLVVARDGLTARRQYDWRVPERFEAPHILELTLIVGEDGAERRSSHSVVFGPFTSDELVDDLEASGFADVEVVRDPGDDCYSVTALRPATRSG